MNKTLTLVANSLADKALAAGITEEKIRGFVEEETDGELSDADTLTVCIFLTFRLEYLLDEDRIVAEIDRKAAYDEGDYDDEDDDGPSTRERGYGDAISPYRDPGAEY